MVSRFRDDPTVKKSRIVALLEYIWVYEKKKRIFGKEEWRMNLGGSEHVETSQSSNEERG